MLNSNIIINILHISYDFLNECQQFFLFVSLYFMRDIHRGGNIEQQFCRACNLFHSLMYRKTRIWFAVSPINEYGNCKFTKLLSLSFINSIVHAWGLMKGQRFHEWIDGLKSLGIPDLENVPYKFCFYHRLAIVFFSLHLVFIRFRKLS